MPTKVELVMLGPLEVLTDVQVYRDYFRLSQSHLTPVASRVLDVLHPIPMTGCWLHPGAPAMNGHVQVTVGRARVYVHRIAWALAHKRWPPAHLKVLHSCDTPSCCATEHLRLGTHQNNVDDMVRRGRQRTGPRLTSAEREAIKLDFASGVPRYKICRQRRHSQKTVNRVLGFA
jgi:hypothetical protein